MKIYRKFILITLVLISILAFTACKNNDDKGSKDNDEIVISPLEDNKDNDNEDTSKPTDEATKDQEDEDEQDIEDNSQDVTDDTEDYIPNFIHKGEPFDYVQHNFYNANLYVKAPAYHEVSHGLRNFHYGKKLTIGYLGGSKSELDKYEVETVEDIMDKMVMVLVNGTKRYVYGDFESFEFDSVEKMTINDIEMIRYEGEMTVAEYQEGDNKRYVVAYTFIHNGTPNAIFGVAGSSTQEPEDIEELIHNVDESAKTIVPKNP